ncbi:hypothetical protein IJ22_05780 [Paenibacillus naphthalenovorans]|uniref:Uncharacterized protein n=1 Tax=Paenibacillus naphthalenovorans TaxID=162209 RepID=A0A0U2W0D8_9BACL|nr:hypothetical protein IJ22_05780 [Paenibacillus naphthalenovorans]SDI59980.1 hypothetical protein SAMN05421868_10870 [Paenibacillus naphthalenovorans]
MRRSLPSATGWLGAGISALAPIALRAQAFAWFAFIEFARKMSSNKLHFLKNKR